MCFILVWQVEEVMALPSAPSKALPAPATARAPRRAGDGAGGGGGNDGSRRRRNSGSKDGAAPLTPVVPVTMPGTPAPTASGAPAAPDTPGSVVAGARPPKKVANFSEKGLATLRDKLEKHVEACCPIRILNGDVKKGEIYQTRRFLQSLETKQGFNAEVLNLEQRLRGAQAALMLLPTESSRLPWDQLQVPCFAFLAPLELNSTKWAYIQWSGLVRF